MKTTVALLTLSICCMVALSDGCEKPFELIACQTQAANQRNDFCSVIGELRKCFEEKAQCPGDVFRKIQEETERQTGVKCSACSSLPSVAVLSVLALGVQLLTRRK